MGRTLTTILASTGLGLAIGTATAATLYQNISAAEVRYNPQNERIHSDLAIGSILVGTFVCGAIIFAGTYYEANRRLSEKNR